MFEWNGTEMRQQVPLERTDDAARSKLMRILSIQRNDMTVIEVKNNVSSFCRSKEELSSFEQSQGSTQKIVQSANGKALRNQNKPRPERALISVECFCFFYVPSQ